MATSLTVARGASCYDHARVVSGPAGSILAAVLRRPALDGRPAAGKRRDPGRARRARRLGADGAAARLAGRRAVPARDPPAVLPGRPPARGLSTGRTARPGDARVCPAAAGVDAAPGARMDAHPAPPAPPRTSRARPVPGARSRIDHRRLVPGTPQRLGGGHVRRADRA